MSLVSTRLSLTQRLSTERDQGAGAVDDWGGSGGPDWQAHLTDVPCRVWTMAAREPVDDEKTVVIEDRRATVPLGTDVTEADRVAQVTDRTGAVIFPGPIGVEGVLRFDDHLELLLERVR